MDIFVGKQNGVKENGPENFQPPTIWRCFLSLIQVALGIPVPRNWCELPGVQIGEFCWTPPPSLQLSYNFRSPLQKNLWNGLNSHFFLSKCHLKEMIPAIFPPFLTCVIQLNHQAICWKVMVGTCEIGTFFSNAKGWWWRSLGSTQLKISCYLLPCRNPRICDRSVWWMTSWRSQRWETWGGDGVGPVLTLSLDSWWSFTRNLQIQQKSRFLLLCRLERWAITGWM